MAIADFEQLCGSFCDIAGIKMPELLPDARGMWSAMIRMHGVELTLMQYEDLRAGTVFLIADFGPMPGHLGVPGWLTLMDANLMHSGAGSPTYSRDPQTGHVLLHIPAPLVSLSAADVYEAITALVDTALEWRADHFVSRPDAAFMRLLPKGPMQLRESEEWARASEDFQLLYNGVEHLLEQGDPMPPAHPEQARAFTAHHSGVRFTVAHSAQEHPHFAWLAMHLGEVSRMPTLEMVTRAMDANFTLMVMAREAKFSRIRDTGELLLQVAYPLKGANPQQFLIEIERFAALALEWASLASDPPAELAARSTQLPQE